VEETKLPDDNFSNTEIELIPKHLKINCTITTFQWSLLTGQPMDGWL